MSELHQCLLRAILRKKLGIKAPKPDLRVVRNEPRPVATDSKRGIEHGKE